MKTQNQESSFRPSSTARILMLCGLLATSMSLFATKSARAANAPGMSGKWKVHNNIAGNESDQECTFTQKGKDLTGSCKGEKDTVDLTGSLDEKKLTYQYKSDYNGTPLTLLYTATVDDPAKITGAVEVQPFGVTGEFTAVPATAATPATPAPPAK